MSAESRDVSLTIPARADFLVLARLALSAVCRLTALSAGEVADLKLALTEAAGDYLDERRDELAAERLSFSFRLRDDRLEVELTGPSVDVPEDEQELGRAIIDATVDECRFERDGTVLLKYLGEG